MMQYCMDGLQCDTVVTAQIYTLAYIADIE